MPTEFNKVKSGVTFTKAAQKQDLQSGDTIPEALGKLAKYMDVTDDALSNIQPILTFDSEPEYESLNPVTSGGLYDYIELQSPTYINTFSTESDLYNYSGNLTNNDYAFVGTGSGATYYMNVYQYKSEVTRDTIENIKTVPSGSNILKTLNEPALPSGNIQYKLDCYVTAVNNQSYGTSPVISVIFSDNTTAQVTVPNANKTHIVKTYSKTIKAIQFMNSGQASDGYTDFEDIQILTTAGWNKLSYRLYNPTWDTNQLSAINSGITSTKVNNYDNHIANKSNPHEVTKSQVGLGNVGNFKAVSTEASQGLTTTEQSNARTNINAQESLSFNGTYNASTNKVATESTVTNAINALDVTSQGGAGKYISEISETDGKISATPTTMDTSLSNSSTNNNCPTSKTVYDDQQRQETEIGVIANAGAKNFAVPFDSISTTDIIVTRNANGSYTFACTNVSENRIIRVANIGNLPSGSYTFSGATGGSSSTYMLGLYNTSASAVKYQHTNTEETYTGNVSGFSLRVRVISGYSGTFTVYPMIRPASITDSTFVPYGKTNADLTNENANQQLEIDYAVNTGAKNLVWYDREAGSQYTTEGRTFTVLSDGGIKITGNNVTQTNADFYLNGLWTTTNVIFDLSDKDYYISLSDNIGSDVGGIMFRAYNRSTGSTVASYSATLAARQRILKDKITTIFITVTTTVTLPSDGIIVYPMIRPAAITDQTYEPYALPNPTLTQAAIKAVDEGAKNLFLNEGQNVTGYGIQCIINSDGTINLDGINTDKKCTGSFNINIGYGQHMRLIEGKRYTLSVNGYQTSDTTLGVYVYTSGLTPEPQWDSYAHQTVAWNIGWNNPNGFRLFIRQGTVVNNLTLKIMICTAEDYAISTAFVPYALSNPVITPALIKQVDDGSKNIANWSADTQTINNVKFVVEDGTVTVSLTSGTTATARSQKILSVVFQDDLESGTYVLSGAPKVTDGGLYLWDSTAGTRVTPTSDTGNGTVFTFDYDKTHKYNLTVDVANGYSIPSGTTLVYKPMICTAADWAVSKKFVPYAPTNRELYEKVDGLGTELVANTNLDNLNIGTYYCGGATIGATLLNSPTHQPFRLIVSYFQSPTNMMQKIIDFNTGTSEIATYIRVKTSSGWKSWYKFEGTEVTS